MTTCNDWDSEAKLPEEFLEIPHRLYASDTHWIPENRGSVEASFGERNPYFDKGAALIFAEDGVRLAGFFSPDLVIDDCQVAFFGYWETPNELETNQRAFKEFQSWAKSKGASLIFGPINFSTFGDYRLRIDGFDRPQFLGEPYNPGYYPRMLESLGYDIRYKYFSACCTIETLAFATKMQMEHLEKKISAAGIEIAPLTPDYWMDNLEQLYPIIDCIFSENFPYTPISYEQFTVYCGECFAKKFCNKMSNVALKDGKVVAFHLFYPDYSPLVTQLHNPPVPIDEIVYAKHFEMLPEPRTFLGKTVGTLPEFRSMGLGYYQGFWGTMRALGHYQFGYGAMVREDNHSVAIKKFAQHNYHYALYTKAI